MGNIIPIPNTTDIMKEKVPDVQIQISLNTAYFYFMFPTLGISEDPITRVVIEMIEYGSLPDGTIDLDNIIDTQILGFDPGIAFYAEQTDDKPLHMIYKKINNSWYDFNFVYTYNSSISETGGNTFYSNQSTLRVNNTLPYIYGNLISKYMRGQFRERLEQRHEIVVWYGVDTQNIQAKIGDVIYRDIHIADVITRLATDPNAPYPYTVGPMDLNYRKAMVFLRKYPDVLNTINSYFKGNPPENGEIPFVFEFNSGAFLILLKGNIKKYLEDVNFIEEEVIEDGSD
jgi:hypothetical protein